MEVSNPSMHLNQLLKELGKSDTSLALANQLLFALVFFVFRLLVGPVVVWATVVSPLSPLIVKIGGVGILAVSLVWFKKARARRSLRGGAGADCPRADCLSRHAQGAQGEGQEGQGLSWIRRELRGYLLRSKTRRRWSALRI